MRLLFFYIFFCLFTTISYAGHIAGGEIYYKYLGPGNGNAKRYEITLRLFRECNPPSGGQPTAPLPPNVILGIFNKSSGNTLTTSVNINVINSQNLQLSKPNFCIVNPPDICYQVGYYTTTQELLDNPNGYIVSFQTCCRTNGIENVSNQQGATYATEIPGINLLNTENNSSSVFRLKDTTLICKNSSFTLDFGADDADGDSLSYSFCDAYNGGPTTNASPVIPSFPPYQTVGYINSYTGSSPLGNAVTINPVTGIISGTSPAPGRYVVTVCVTEWRKGIAIGVNRKDFTLRIGDCELSGAKLNPTYVSCEGYTWTFANESTSSAVLKYFWDFGVTTIKTDTSSLPSPVYTYADTGSYKIKLRVENSLGCADSAESLLNVFPGFTPNFTVTGSCFLNPYIFTNTSVVAFGKIDSVFWNFGDLSVTTDTSTKINSTYKYDIFGSKTIRLYVRSTKGCEKEILRTVDIKDKPIIDLPFRDTLICSIDTLPLRVNTSGNILWSSNKAAFPPSNPVIANPFVTPKDTTIYRIRVDDNGCINTDSIIVNVLDFIDVELGLDTGICRTDTITLKPVSDALSYKWLPATGLSSDNVRNPKAFPLATTKYYVTANLGYCQDADSITIKVAPYPQITPLTDPIICFGTRIQLNASIVGSSFNWRPANNLLNANTLQPTAAPSRTTNYILTVSDTVGCPKPVTDTITVTVIPPIVLNAGKDTSIVVNQPLQFNPTGGYAGLNYSWTPGIGLNNPNIINPIATLGIGIDSVKYKLRGTDDSGCYGEDEVLVRVFNALPQIFVPSGFTPNNDGRNDIIRPICVGITQLNYFRIFNRWGQLLYSTSEMGKGWDGRIGGQLQNAGTFVYAVEGLDYTGKKITKEGTVVLIR